MLKKISFILGALTVGAGFFLASFASFGQSATTTTEQTTTEVQATTPVPKKAKKAVTTSTSSSTTITTTSRPAQPRQVLDEETLKKISNTLCTEGFKAYVGSDKKNICQGKATTPDLAYSCVWDKKGAAAYAPTAQGPCTLDYAEHRGSVIVTKETFASSPPLAYGKEAQCCFRAAVGQ